MKDRSLIGIFLLVLIAHGFALLWLDSVYLSNPPLASRKAVVVKTVQLTPKRPVETKIEPIALVEPKIAQEPVAKIEIAPPQKAVPKPIVKPLPQKQKKAPPPSPVSKKPAKPSPPPPPPKQAHAEEETKAKQRNLLSQAKEKMEKINKGSSFVAETQVTIPRQIESLHLDSLSIETLSEKESTYSDELAYRLKLLLKLPKYGDVKLRLTLDRSGNVTKLAILDFQNEENKNYLEKSLLKLKFPAFGTHFPGQEEYTFTLTLSNET